MALLVMNPGVLSTIQDAGRKGYLGSGFSPSGAMDMRAYRRGNALLGNRPGVASLEFCLMGPTLRFTRDTYCVLTGGDFGAKLDGESVAVGHTVMVRRGQELKLGRAERGMYGYLAVTGGFDEPVVMNSRSTNLKCGVGGHGGRALVTGDILWAAEQIPGYRPGIAGRAYPSDDAFYQFGSPVVELRVVLGPQEQLFTEEGIRTFLTQEFETTSQSDRMGARLEGPKVATVAGSDIVSDGIAFGAVQIPNHGKPIIMLADRQTTGGYAKIATVASVDIPKLVQCKPGTKVRFTQVSVEEAQELLREDYAAEARLIEEIRA
ncbi:MAG: biotin-dependent carboxyltransferase family protein [Coriobacteriia bacterium]|nr:biotin-dependent carboxyltransferase family protein [Coriobacteriia bacterium]